VVPAVPVLPAVLVPLPVTVVPPEELTPELPVAVPPELVAVTPEVVPVVPETAPVVPEIPLDMPAVAVPWPPSDAVASDPPSPLSPVPLVNSAPPQATLCSGASESSTTARTVCESEVVLMLVLPLKAWGVPHTSTDASFCQNNASVAARGGPEVRRVTAIRAHRTSNEGMATSFTPSHAVVPATLLALQASGAPIQAMDEAVGWKAASDDGLDARFAWKDAMIQATGLTLRVTGGPTRRNDAPIMTVGCVVRVDRRGHPRDRRAVASE
jgi:hypothetical protein